MKHLIRIVIVMWLLAGCSNVMDTAQVHKGLPVTETGRVNISVTGTAERTVLPQIPVFTKYEFIFIGMDGQPGYDSITVNGEQKNINVSVDLVPGTWIIMVKGYVYISGIEGIPDGDYQAAQGEKEITVRSDYGEYIDIDIKGGVHPAGKGILSWDMALPENTQSAALIVRDLEGTVLKTEDIKTAPRGETVLDAGYYFIALILDNKQPRIEALHIYAAMTTPVNLLTWMPAFNDLNDIRSYVSRLPLNTADTPYDIILYDFNLETDFGVWYTLQGFPYRYFDALGRIAGAWVGGQTYENHLYVNLDLSACYGNIPDSDLPLDGRYHGVGYCFYSIVSIILPDDTTTIGKHAFQDFQYLKSINLPAGLTVISDYMFKDCWNLDITELPAGITHIGDGAFAIKYAISYIYGKSIRLTKLPAGVTTIGHSAFSDCRNLALTELPPGITSIGYSAFFRTNITLTELPQGITSIEDWTFYYCSNLALTELPAGITCIGERAFEDCLNIILNELPPGITSIGSWAFNNCPNITLTELPSGITSIEDYAFGDCTSLALTGLPAGITSIGSMAFYNCPNIMLTELPSGITSIGNRAFGGCTNLALTGLPAGIASIEDYTFDGCTSLALTVLPTGIISIGNGAFWGCSNLMLIELPAGITSIGNEAFVGCTSLALTKLPSGITSISDGAFGRCTSLALTGLPAGITSIGNGAFGGCTSLALTGLPSGITSIGYRAFAGCTSLALTELPTSVTVVEESTFENCTNLQEFTLHAGITSVGYRAFSECDNLRLVIIHAETVPDGYGSWVSPVFYSPKLAIQVPVHCLAAYKSAWGDSRIMVIPDETVFSYNTVNDFITGISNASENVIGFPYTVILSGINLETDFLEIVFNGYSNEVRALGKLYNALEGNGKFVNLDLSACTGQFIPDSNYYYEQGRDKIINITLPQGLTTIGNNAFCQCTNLLMTELPDKLTTIGDMVFSDCINLSLTELPAGLISIGRFAFSKTNLTLTKLPDSITFIPDGAFMLSTNLVSIKLSPEITTIESAAFRSCSNLEVVIVPAIIPPILGAEVFYGTHNDLLIKVPAQSVVNYKSAPGWAGYVDRIFTIE